jgi:ACS family hexuronate transporter-like MFS transporter
MQTTMPKRNRGLKTATPIDVPAEITADNIKAGGGFRWTVCGLLFAATSINYMDRQVLGILKPVLQEHIGFSETQYGYIISAFTAAYATGLLVVGRLVDKLGTRVGYALIMGVWSIAAMSHALVTSALGFAVARVFLGLGESGNFPAAIKTTAEWFPRKERSLATGIFNSGANMGAILAPLLIPWVALRFSWRAGFLVTGAFSATWIIWWLTRYRKPSEQPRLGDRERAFIHSDPPESTVAIPWIRLLGFRQTWAIAAGKFLTDPIWWFLLYWLPDYFTKTFHMKLTELFIPLVVVYNLAAIGSIGGGYLPVFYHGIGASLTASRRLAMLTCAIAVTPVYFVGHTHSLWQAVALVSLAAAAHQGWSANILTTPSDMFPRSAVGAIVGIGGTAGALGGVLFPILIGKVLDLTHSYAIPFAIAAAAYLLGLGVMQLVAPGFKRVDHVPQA